MADRLLEARLKSSFLYRGDGGGAPKLKVMPPSSEWDEIVLYPEFPATV